VLTHASQTPGCCQARAEGAYRACAQAAGGPGGVKAVQVKARDSDWMGMTNKCAPGYACMTAGPVCRTASSRHELCCFSLRCTSCRRISLSAFINGETGGHAKSATSRHYSNLLGPDTVPSCKLAS